MYLSIVIPAYNEETNIRLGTLEKVAAYLSKQTYSWEVIVVDDGSSDGTSKLLDQFAATNSGFRVMHNSHQGKAGTVISGMLSGTGEIILFSDLDQATPLMELDKLLPWFAKGYDIVIGSRSGRREGAPLTRRVMARGFMLLRSYILGLHNIVDTQCGFKAFRGPVARDIFGRLRLYSNKHQVSGSSVTAGFDIEVLFLGRKLKYKIKEVSVEWHYVETRRVSPLRDSWLGLLDILTIRLMAWQGRYGV